MSSTYTRSAYLTKGEADEANRAAIARLLVDIARVQTKLEAADRSTRSIRSPHLERHSLRCKQIRLVAFQRLLAKGGEDEE